MKIASTRYSDTTISFAAFILRMGLGFLMLIPHGWDKLQHFSEKSHNFLDPLHIGSTLTLCLAIFIEVFCSFFVILGLFTRIACVPLIIEMLVVIFLLHHGSILPNAEKEGLFLAGYLALIFMGPGKVSIDKLIGK